MNTRILLTAAVLALSGTAYAEIYKQVDADGRVTYSNVPSKGAVKLNLEPPAQGGGSGAAPSQKARVPTPANFPRVDEDTQRVRDDKRRQILESELAGERKALEEAKKNYTEGEANPESFIGKDGKRYRNMAKFDEKMQKLREEVSQHEKNIELLEKEINNLK
ncbi:MAG: DUF4124 domain-containing protein [Methylobacterium sp.]|nr:DUF4124 domain-containing protein [Methylobacterium sp.]